MKKEWTEDETNLFIEVYPLKNIDELCKIFGRTKGSIFTKASKMKLGKKVSQVGVPKLTKQDMKYIEEHYSHERISDISKYIGKPKSTIKYYAEHYLRIKSHHWWKDSEILFLQNNFSSESIKYICDGLGKKWKAISKKAKLLGLKRLNKHGKEYIKSIKCSNEELLFISKNYNNMTVGEMASFLGRSNDFVSNICKNNGFLVFRKRKDVNNISNKTLLDILCIISEEIGGIPSIKDIQLDKRTPSIDTYYDRFGSFSSALSEAGLLGSSCGTYGKSCFSKNNDYCRSDSERIITNFLIDNNIYYNKEVKYSSYVRDLKRNYVCDWVLKDSTFVEYFGLVGIKEYDEKTKDKISICKRNKINLIQIYPEEIKYLNKVFKNYL